MTERVPRSSHNRNAAGPGSVHKRNSHKSKQTYPQMPYSRRKPSIARMVLKLIVAFLLGLFLMSAGLFFLEEAEWAFYDKDEALRVSFCDEYYYKRDFARLRDELTLYDLQGEHYDIYWEVVDGYEDYVEYWQWNRTDEEAVSGSSEKASYYRQKVIANARNCEYEKNQKILDKWAQEAELESEVVPY